ncbi:hypothetical protein Tco_0427476 [Tanacetum coccineum]
MPSPSVSTFTFPSTTEPVFSASTSEPVFESPNHPQTSQTTQSQQLQQYHTTTVSNNNAKFPYLKKEEYETWAMKMEYWIMNSDHNLWNIVLNGNSRKRTGRDPKGNIMILPPVSVEEHIVVQRETKARTILLQLLKELTTSKTPEKVLIREEAKFLVTKNVNSISLTRGEEERSDKIDIATVNDIDKPTRIETGMQANEAETKNGARKEEITEVPSSQPVEYYLKHSINNKLIEGLVDNRIAEDILVEVAEHVYPVDFVILDIKEDEMRPFILGTPGRTMS